MADAAYFLAPYDARASLSAAAALADKVQQVLIAAVASPEWRPFPFPVIPARKPKHGPETRPASKDFIKPMVKSFSHGKRHEAK